RADKQRVVNDVFFLMQRLARRSTTGVSSAASDVDKGQTLYYIISFKQRLVIAINNHIAETGFRTVNVRLFKKSGLHKNATASISNYATHTCANTNFKRLILIALLIFSYS
uniref:hypothetical protein n=4 Tax=Enterobacterales TaxID=91347 RepID=UPI002B24E563